MESNCIYKSFQILLLNSQQHMFYIIGSKKQHFFASLEGKGSKQCKKPVYREHIQYEVFFTDVTYGTKALLLNESFQ